MLAALLPCERVQKSVNDLAAVQVSVLIIGAGPTGLGAATRLQQHGHHDWLLVDQVTTKACSAAVF